MVRFIQTLKNCLRAILHGELLMRFDRFFVHIIWTFLLFWAVILSGMMVQKTLVKVEQNKKTLTDMKIYHAQKTVELARLGRLTTVETLLEQNGSEVTLPEKPADIIPRK